MKKTFILSCLFLFLSFSINAQKQPVKVELSDKDSYTMIMIPDPQTYIKFDVNQPIFELMTAWVANNIEDLNMAAVLCTGDLVEQNDQPIPEGRNGNQTGRQQWENVSRAFERLDNRISYVNATGNHDYGYVSAENRFSQFPEFFRPERNTCWRKSLVSVGRNWEEKPTLENAAYEFEMGNWGKVLVVSLEFAPRDEALDWAKNLVNSEKYKDHKVIVLTHSYMNTKGVVYEKENYKVTPANYGQAIWNKLIAPSPTIRMVLCGHSAIADGDDYEKNVSFRVDKNQAGKDVVQMMFDAQTAGGGWHGNGGDGWLRILEFMPDGKTVKVRTFSPFFAISPTTAKHAWRTASYDQFEFVID